MKYGFLLAAAIAAFLPGVAAAQEFPNRPLRLLVPFAPGGNTDILARAVSLPARSVKEISFPAELARFIRSETDKYAKVIKTAGIEQQ